MNKALFLLFILCSAQPLFAQKAPEGLWQGYDGEWRHVSLQLIALAEATPEEKFACRPAPGVRSSSEVYMHIVMATFYLLSVTGPKMPADLKEGMDKTVTAKVEVIAWLKRSLDAVRGAHLAETPKNLERKVHIADRDADRGRNLSPDYRACQRAHGAAGRLRAHERHCPTVDKLITSGRAKNHKPLFPVAKPEDSIREQKILLLARKYFVAVPHVHVDHSIACVGPHHGQVSDGYRVFKPNRIILGVQREQHSDLLVETRTGFPDVPLVCRGHKHGRQSTRHRVRAVVYRQRRGKRRPVIPVENRPAQEIHEPRPPSAFVVVAGYMETQPGPATAHIILKSFPLLCGVSKVVKPKNQLESLQIFGVQICPSCCRLKFKIVFPGQVSEENQGLSCKVDMVGLALVGIKSEYAEGSQLRRSRIAQEKAGQLQADATKEKACQNSKQQHSRKLRWHRHSPLSGIVSGFPKFVNNKSPIARTFQKNIFSSLYVPQAFSRDTISACHLLKRSLFRSYSVAPPSHRFAHKPRSLPPHC